MGHLDQRLLSHYDRELHHLREMGAEFARRYEKVAGRLGLDGQSTEACPDPYVERLLEGFAFLAARIHVKLDAEFPRLTQSLLQTVYPHYLAPTPSMLIAGFEPDLRSGDLAGGVTVPRDTALLGHKARQELTRCEYRTAHDITLWPLELAEARYHSQDLSTLRLPGSGEPAQAALRFRLRLTAGAALHELPLERLPVHLKGGGNLPVRLYEEIFAGARQVVIQPPVAELGLEGERRVVNPASTIKRMGFEDEHALLPAGRRTFQGYRLLQEYFAFYQRFLFFEFTDLAAGVAAAPGRELDLIITLDRAVPELERLVDVSNFQLYCTPAINLFPKRADRIHLSERFAEFHVVPDRTRVADFEVYEIREVVGHGLRRQQQEEFHPFYAASDLHQADAYYTVAREPRTAARGSDRTNSYAGSEVFINLVDAAEQPYRGDLTQLSVKTLCTNRDLPLHMPVGGGVTDFTLEQALPIRAVRCVSNPTPPHPSRAEGDLAWRLVSHLSLNYLSLVDDERPGEAVASLREMLRLYAEHADPALRRQVDGVVGVSVAPVTRRAPIPGPVTFVRGLQVTLDFQEAEFEGVGAFLLGAVLEQFFAKYVALNSFTETVVRTEQRGELIQWPPRIGKRHLI